MGFFDVGEYDLNINLLEYKLADTKWRPIFTEINKISPNLIYMRFQGRSKLNKHELVKKQNGGSKMVYLHFFQKLTKPRQTLY
jgi:hypothetical protein